LRRGHIGDLPARTLKGHKLPLAGGIQAGLRDPESDLAQCPARFAAWPATPCAVERCRQPGSQLFDLGDDPELVRHGTSRATPVLTSTIA
jgi:hypothetical protein